MEINLTSRTLAAMALLVATLSGCSGAPTRGKDVSDSQAAHGKTLGPVIVDDAGPSSASPETMGPPELFGPPLPEPAPAVTAEPYGPEPAKVKTVVLVLGPGQAKGFAGAGVIRALIENRISIGAVLGTEMGALVGALYAVNPKLNHLEWALLKLKGTDPENWAAKEFSKFFGTADIEKLPILFRCAIEYRTSGLPVVVRKGSLLAAVRAAVSSSAHSGEASWEGVPAGSAENTQPLLIEEARNLGLGPVLVVDVNHSMQKLSAEEAGKADLVLRPDMTGIRETEYSKASEITYRGKMAVTKKILQIRAMIDEVPSRGAQR